MTPKLSSLAIYKVFNLKSVTSNSTCFLHLYLNWITLLKWHKYANSLSTCYTFFRSWTSASTCVWSTDWSSFLLPCNSDTKIRCKSPLVSDWISSSKSLSYTVTVGIFQHMFISPYKRAVDTKFDIYVFIRSSL